MSDIIAFIGFMVGIFGVVFAHHLVVALVGVAMMVAIVLCLRSR